MASETSKGADESSTLPDPAAGLRASAALARRRELRPGTRVGAYVIKEVLGRGGMGTVYRAVQPMIDGQVAIKVVAPEMSANTEAVERFVREARVVNKIRHAHIVQIFDFGRLDSGGQYCVMELLHGETLKALLARRRPLMLLEAQHVVDGVAQALDAAHAAGVVHRDLKPANIFLVHAGAGRAPLVKLLDFGVAKLVGGAALESSGEGGSWSPSELKTKLGSTLGTPAYMSPEQRRAAGVDHRSDIFSLGVLAFEMIVGHRPKEEELADLGRSSCPPTARGVLARALAERPSRRQKSAGSFAKALRAATPALQSEDGAWRGDGPATPASPQPFVGRTLTRAGPSARPWRLLAAALFVLVAAAMVLWLAVVPGSVHTPSNQGVRAGADVGSLPRDLGPDEAAAPKPDAPPPRLRRRSAGKGSVRPARRRPRKKKTPKRVIRDMPVRFR